MTKTPFIALLYFSWIGQGIYAYNTDVSIGVYDISSLEEPIIIHDAFYVLHETYTPIVIQNNTSLHSEETVLFPLLDLLVSIITTDGYYPYKMSFSYDAFSCPKASYLHHYQQQQELVNLSFLQEPGMTLTTPYIIQQQLNLEKSIDALPPFNISNNNNLLSLVEIDKTSLQQNHTIAPSISCLLPLPIVKNNYPTKALELLSNPILAKEPVISSIALPEVTALNVQSYKMEYKNNPILTSASIALIENGYFPLNKISIDNYSLLVFFDKQTPVIARYPKEMDIKQPPLAKEDAPTYFLALATSNPIDANGFCDQNISFSISDCITIITMPSIHDYPSPAFSGHINHVAFIKTKSPVKNMDKAPVLLMVSATTEKLNIIAKNTLFFQSSFQPDIATTSYPASCNHLATCLHDQYIAFIQQPSRIVGKYVFCPTAANCNLSAKAPTYLADISTYESHHLSPNIEVASHTILNSIVDIYLAQNEIYTFTPIVKQDHYTIADDQNNSYPIYKLQHTFIQSPQGLFSHYRFIEVADNRFILDSVTSCEEKEKYNSYFLPQSISPILTDMDLFDYYLPAYSWNIVEAVAIVEYIPIQDKYALSPQHISSCNDCMMVVYPISMSSEHFSNCYAQVQQLESNNITDTSTIILNNLADTKYKDFLLFAMENLAKEDREDFLLTDRKKLVAFSGQAYGAKQINQQLRLLGYQLALLPKPEDLQTFNFSDEFSKKIKIAAKPDGTGYYFSIELKPYSQERLDHIKQNVYFVIDNNESTDQPLFKAYTSAIAKSLSYMHPDDAFNVLIYDGTLKTFSQQPTSAFDKYQNGVTTFLNKNRYKHPTASKNISNLLHAIYEKTLETPDEVHTVILLSNGASLYSSTTKGQNRINEALAAYTKAFSIYPATVSKASNIRSLEKLSDQYRGKLIQSSSLAGLSRFVGKQVKQLQRPVLKNIYITPILKEKQQIKIFPNTNHFPEMFSQTPLIIYGFTNSIYAFDLFIQGTINQAWMNAKIKVSIDSAENGGSDLRKKCMALEYKHAHLSQL
ncbi:MAG: hypothetical protein HY860_03945 [Chlamydiales bacterium]|nr:hypothetical protein [Chlamydiales bacterium]